MTVLSALRSGIGRVNAAPAVLISVALVTLLLAMPLGLTLRGMIEAHLGSSLAAETAASGVNHDWWEEFRSGATGLGTTFDQTIIGFAAVLDNISRLLDNRAMATVLTGVAAVYILVWAFLMGGILDRYARHRPIRSHGFFGASGVFFFRFLRLGVLAGIVYAALFRFVHPLLFDRFFENVTRDLTVERTAFLWRVTLYMLFGLLLALCALVFDYAKVRAVVEDRRSMIGALGASVRFIRRHAAAVIPLYLLNGLLFLLVVLAYAFVAPGAGTTGSSMWIGFAIGQLYLLARIWVKLVCYASQVAFFQGALAHASYTAAPQPVWPESPAAEAIGNPVP